MIQDNILDHFTIWVTFTGSRPRTRIFLERHVGIYVQLCVEWILRVPDEHMRKILTFLCGQSSLPQLHPAETLDSMSEW